MKIMWFCIPVLRPLGCEVKSPLDIVQNKNDTDTVVYTSAHFQPCAESFDQAHYRFVGPSAKPAAVGIKDADRSPYRGAGKKTTPPVGAAFSLCQGFSKVLIGRRLCSLRL